MNDQTLAEKAAGGCRASFAALIERHDERIYRLAWRICGTQAQAICGWRRRLTHADEPLRDEIVLAGEFYGLATERECRRKEYGAVERLHIQRLIHCFKTITFTAAGHNTPIAAPIRKRNSIRELASALCR